MARVSRRRCSREPRSRVGARGEALAAASERDPGADGAGAATGAGGELVEADAGGAGLLGEPLVPGAGRAFFLGGAVGVPAVEFFCGGDSVDAGGEAVDGGDEAVDSDGDAVDSDGDTATGACARAAESFVAAGGGAAAGPAGAGLAGGFTARQDVRHAMRSKPAAAARSVVGACGLC